MPTYDNPLITVAVVDAADLTRQIHGENAARIAELEGRPLREHDYRLHVVTPAGSEVLFRRGATADDVAAYWEREGCSSTPATGPEPKTWVEQATAQFGEPDIAFPEPVVRFGLNRRCWVWFVDGHNFNVAIDLRDDRPHDRYKVTAASPRRLAEIYTNDEPTDAEIRSALNHAWPGFRTEPEAQPQGQATGDIQLCRCPLTGPEHVRTNLCEVTR